MSWAYRISLPNLAPRDAASLIGAGAEGYWTVTAGTAVILADDDERGAVVVVSPSKSSTPSEEAALEQDVLAVVELLVRRGAHLVLYGGDVRVLSFDGAALQTDEQGFRETFTVPLPRWASR